MESESIGRLVRRLRRQRGLTQGQLATYAQVTRSWLSLVELDKRERPEREMLERLAAILRVPAENLLAAAGYRVTPLPEREERTPFEIVRELEASLRRQPKAIMVPVVQSFAAAGTGAVADVEYWPYVPTPEQVGHDIIGARAKGNCLFPRVRDGDQVYIDRNASPKHEDVVAVTVDGESLLRILDLVNQQLTSKNGHPPMPLTDRVHIEGVVVFAGKRP